MKCEDCRHTPNTQDCIEAFDCDCAPSSCTSGPPCSHPVPDPTDLPPKWITDTYGLALMMIREGCADPRRVAAEALEKGGHGENARLHRTLEAKHNEKG